MRPHSRIRGLQGAITLIGSIIRGALCLSRESADGSSMASCEVTSRSPHGDKLVLKAYLLRIFRLSRSSLHQVSWL